MSPKFSKKAALLALVALAVLGVLVAAVWLYPPLLLYGMLTITGVAAYVAVYFIVLSKLRRPTKSRANAAGLPEQDLSR